MGRRDSDRRRRVSREDVRRNAREAGGGRNWFVLPKGVREFEISKAGSYLLDVVPYEVKAKHHPDKVDQGVLWYKYPFVVHHNVGPNNESVVCPGTVGKPCPICEEKARLAKNYNDNEEQIKSLRAQKHVVYNIVDPEDKDAVALFCMSRGKFAEPLEKELQEGDDDVQLFFDTTKDGKTIKVRFSDAKFDGRAYIEATRIDFRERPEMDENEVLSRTVCLDECFNIIPYDRLKALFLQVGEDEDTEDAGSQEEEPPVKSPRGARPPEPEEEPEEKVDEELRRDSKRGSANRKPADDEDSAEEEKPRPKPKRQPEPEPEPESEGLKEGDVVQWTNRKGKVVSGKIVSIDGDDVMVEDTEERQYMVSPDDITPVQGGEEGDDDADDAPAPAKGKCPHGHKFGVDTDAFKECEKCKVWVDCDRANKPIGK